MGTKNNPGIFDCYAFADPDEPMFILLGRDTHAPALVRLWARERAATFDDSEKVAEARLCADAMAEWLKKLGKTEVEFSESVTITLAQALEVVELFGDDAPEDTEVVVSSGTGHSGPGIYAWLLEYPEEGAQFITGKEVVK